MIALLAALAFADPECTVEPATTADSLSVAWISPVRRAVGNNSWMEVVPTSQLRQFVAEKEPSVGGMLRHYGMRERPTEPHRRWKVTVFEVRGADLCAPVEGGAWRIQWRNAAPQGFCVFPAERFVQEAGGSAP